MQLPYFKMDMVEKTMGGSKKTVQQSSSQIKFQELPSTSRDSSLRWTEHNPDCTQFSDLVLLTASERTLPTPASSLQNMWHSLPGNEGGIWKEGGREWD